MSGVVIRCQHCGTTQAALGECEACHEGDARYYCPNHTPGRWLDAPSCSACGARVGVPPKAVPSPPRRADPPPRRTEPPPRSAAPRRPPEAEPPSPRYREPVREEFEEVRSERYDDAIESLRRDRGVRPRDIIEEFIRTRAARGGLGSPVGMPAVAGAFGCLRRLVMLIIVLVVLAFLAFFGLFGVGGLLYGATGSNVRAYSAAPDGSGRAGA